jgi:hypothetical protein
VFNDPQPGMDCRVRRYQNTKSIHASIYRQFLAVFFCLRSRAELLAILGGRQGKVLTEVMAQRCGIADTGLLGDTIDTQTATSLMKRSVSLRRRALTISPSGR